MKIEVL